METTMPSRSRRGRVSESAACCPSTPAARPTLDAARTATLAERLKALADPTRLRMLDLLAAQRDALCVCDITSQFALQQPTISHHLRILRDVGLIRGEKRGVWSYYQATDLGKQSLSILRTLP